MVAWEKTEKERGRKRNHCWTAERTTQAGTPAVKTSNHMRKSKRFLRVPLFHLLNFYNLVDCQALGSTNTSFVPEGRDRQKDREQDSWLNHPSHPQRSAFMTRLPLEKEDSLCIACVLPWIDMFNAFGTHTQPGLHCSGVRDLSVVLWF